LSAGSCSFRDANFFVKRLRIAPENNGAYFYFLKLQLHSCFFLTFMRLELLSRGFECRLDTYAFRKPAG